MKNIAGERGPMADWSAVAAVPGIAEALEALHREYGIGLATNGSDSDSPMIRRALARVQIDPYVERIYCQREIGFRKPDRRFFEFIKEDLQPLGVEHLVMIGDDFETDILGAARADVFGVWFNPLTRENKESELWTTIHTPQELPGIIRQIFPAAELQ